MSLRDKQPTSSDYLPADNVIFRKLGMNANFLSCAPGFMGNAIKKILVVDDSSLSRKVIPSSPGSLYGFLASLSAIYMQAGLVTSGRRLAETPMRVACRCRNSDRLLGLLRGAGAMAIFSC